MALHVTQCPTCDTTFNTNARLLEAAHGLVRCGACLSVFEARENFVTPKPNDTGDDQEQDAQESVFISGQEDFLDVARFVRTASGLNETRRGTDETDAAGEPVAPEMFVQRYRYEDLEPLFDGDIPAGEPVVPEPDPLGQFTDAIMDSYASVSEAVPVQMRSPEPEPVLAPEPDPETVFAPEPTPEPEPVLAPEPASEKPLAAEARPDPAPAVEPVAQSKAELRARLSRVRLDDIDDALDDLSADHLSAIYRVPDALELENHRPPRRILHTVGLGALNLLLLVSLAGQFLWQRVDLLSLDRNLRPVYQLACDLLQCRLPPLEDLGNLQVENLLVRSHPSEADALVVSAVLRNTAGFQQPFPQLHLQFSDQSLRPVAGRDFQPAEYLPQALRSIVNMPVNAPVQVTLEILDPGSDAVNYELTLESRY